MNNFELLSELDWNKTVSALLKYCRKFLKHGAKELNYASFSPLWRQNIWIRSCRRRLSLRKIGYRILIVNTIKLFQCSEIT